MPEYNPLNERIKKEYEDALLHGKYRDPKTVRIVWNNINLFERFTKRADFKSFNKEQAKSFKIWFEKQENKDGKPLSVATIRSVLENIRSFFAWLAMHPQYIRKIDGRAVEYLRMSNNQNRAARATRDRPPPTIEELKTTLKAMPYETDIEKRNRAVFAFTIITGVRDDALVSLKQKHVTIKDKTVWQDPKHMRTKGSKGILTRFVGQPIPLAEEIVLAWIDYAQNTLKLKNDEPLFPKTCVKNNPKTLAFEAQGLSKEHWANAQPVRMIFKAAFKHAGITYYNPHLFRHMLVKWGLKNLNQYEFKALSQNIGHEHAMTTYNSYGKLSQDEQVEAIANIGTINPSLNDVPTSEILAEMARRTGR